MFTGGSPDFIEMDNKRIGDSVCLQHLPHLNCADLNREAIIKLGEAETPYESIEILCMMRGELTT